MNEAFRVVAAFCAMLERLGVRHLIGGSLASSVHGVPRATQDVDLVADLQPAHAKRLSELARVECHVDERAVESAISDVASFNALHRETVFKVDVFVAGDDPWVVEELRRARIVEIPDVGRLPFASVEDVVLHKLRSYDEGGRISERQWRDVVGMIAVHGDDLDREHLDRWTDHLGIRELLESALDS